MKQLSKAAEGAKELKALLKKAFPAVKFSVTCSNYSMGSSIQVSWEDGATKSAVEAIANNMQSCSMNMYEDIKEYTNPSGKADWVFCDRKISPEFAASIMSPLRDEWKLTETTEELIEQLHQGTIAEHVRREYRDRIAATSY